MKRQLIKLSGANFTTPNLPVLNVTAEEIEIVSMPNIVTWLNPDLRFSTTFPAGIKDRVNGYAYRAFSNNPLDINNHLNDQLAIHFDRASATGIESVDSSLHPLGSYTKIMVVQPSAIVNSIFCSSTSDLCQFKLNNSGRLEIRHGNIVRQTSSELLINQPYVIAACYNADTNTAKCFINGSESPLNISSIPLQAEDGYVCFGFARTSGLFFDGYMGDAMVFDVDYSKPAFSDYFARLHTILSTKYSITLR